MGFVVPNVALGLVTLVAPPIHNVLLVSIALHAVRVTAWVPVTNRRHGDIFNAKYCNSLINTFYWHLTGWVFDIWTTSVTTDSTPNWRRYGGKTAGKNNRISNQWNLLKSVLTDDNETGYNRMRNWLVKLWRILCDRWHSSLICCLMHGFCSNIVVYMIFVRSRQLKKTRRQSNR